MLGTEVIVGRKIKSTLVDFEAMPDKICKFILRDKFRKLNLLNVYTS